MSFKEKKVEIWFDLAGLIHARGDKKAVKKPWKSRKIKKSLKIKESLKINKIQENQENPWKLQTNFSAIPLGCHRPHKFNHISLAWHRRQVKLAVQVILMTAICQNHFLLVVQYVKWVWKFNYTTASPLVTLLILRPRKPSKEENPLEKLFPMVKQFHTLDIWQFQFIVYL